MSQPATSPTSPHPPLSTKTTPIPNDLNQGRFNTLLSRRTRRPTIGTPSDFRIVSKSHTLNLQSMTNHTQRQVSTVQRYGTLKQNGVVTKPPAVANSKDGPEKAQEDRLGSRNRSVDTNTNLPYRIAVVVQKVKEVCNQHCTLEKLDILLYRTQGRQPRRIESCSSRSRTRSRSRSKSKSKSSPFRAPGSVRGKGRLASPCTSTHIPTYGTIIKRPGNHKSAAYPTASLRLQRVMDPVKSTSDSQLGVYHMALKHPQYHLCFMPELYSLEAYGVERVKETLVTRSEKRGRVGVKKEKGRAIEGLRLGTDSVISKISVTALDLPPKASENQGKSFNDLPENEDSDCISDDGPDNIAPTIKRPRSNSTPERDRGKKHFASYTRVLDTIGPFWLSQLNQPGSEAEACSILSSIIEDLDMEDADSFKSRSAFEDEGHDERNNTLEIINGSFLLDYFTNGDEEDGVSTHPKYDHDPEISSLVKTHCNRRLTKC